MPFPADGLNRQTEVDDGELDAAEEDIVRHQIAMDHAVGVQEGQRPHQLPGQTVEVLRAQRVLARIEGPGLLQQREGQGQAEADQTALVVPVEERAGGLAEADRKTSGRESV